MKGVGVGTKGEEAGAGVGVEGGRGWVEGTRVREGTEEKGGRNEVQVKGR